MILSSPPTKLELLEVLVRVLEQRDEEDRQARAIRETHVADEDGVLRALVELSSATWRELHVWFPEAQWVALGATLSTLQRAEKIRLDPYGSYMLRRPEERPYPR